MMSTRSTYQTSVLDGSSLTDEALQVLSGQRHSLSTGFLRPGPGLTQLTHALRQRPVFGVSSATELGYWTSLEWLQFLGFRWFLEFSKQRKGLVQASLRNCGIDELPHGKSIVSQSRMEEKEQGVHKSTPGVRIPPVKPHMSNPPKCIWIVYFLTKSLPSNSCISLRPLPSLRVAACRYPSPRSPDHPTLRATSAPDGAHTEPREVEKCTSKMR